MLSLIGFIFLAMAAHGYYTGRVMAGSRGFKGNWYTREDNPILFAFFVGLYLLTGVLVILMGLGIFVRAVP